MDSVHAPFSWYTLPTEVKLAIVDNLGYADVKSLAWIDSPTYHACVPALFQSVHLKNYDAIRRFIDTVPWSYRHHIQHLDLSMFTGHVDAFGFQNYDKRPSFVDQAQSVVSLLTCCSRLEKLALRMAGSMDVAVLTAFPHIPHLKDLTISNCLKDEDAPVSERLVVYIAASLPNLHTLNLDRISRSTMHSPELDYAYPPIPRVINDDDVPSHPFLGTHLNLPSLLRLPSLRRLSIKDTHLGDSEWELTVPPSCKLEYLELGDCCYESELGNGLAIQRLLRAAGASIVDLTLGSSVPLPSSPSSSLFSSLSESDLGPVSGSTSVPFHNSIRSSISLPIFGNLKIIRISPFFPIESLSEALSNFAGSPIEVLSIECVEDDVLEVCQAVEDFLSLRVCQVLPSSGLEKLAQRERDFTFFGDLKRIEVVATQTQGWAECAGSLYRQKQEQMRYMALKGLLRYCRDLGLAGMVRRNGSAVGVGGTIPGGVDGVVGWCLDDEDCCWEAEVVPLS
ncbi:hypothetical protein AX15_001195 [Amanita polypyramis BW_CC]|nr:hypothetical protein AX15_001195 [Amanita polypyramis BW_CC]